MSSTSTAVAGRGRICETTALLLLLIGICCTTITAGVDDEASDALYLPGVTIPIENIRIIRIEAGQVIYRDAGGRRHQRRMEDVGSLHFAGLPELDRAEALVREGNHDRAMPHYLQALVNAADDMQRLWIHARLARAHDIRGEYAQAASHAAAVFLLEEHIVWRDVEPVRASVGDLSPTAVAEARLLLREARRRITQRDLSQAIARMTTRIEQMAESVDDHSTDDVQPRTTWLTKVELATSRPDRNRLRLRSRWNQTNPDQGGMPTPATVRRRRLIVCSRRGTMRRRLRCAGASKIASGRAMLHGSCISTGRRTSASAGLTRQRSSSPAARSCTQPASLRRVH